MRNRMKKLQINKETIRRLGVTYLQEIQGGTLIDLTSGGVSTCGPNVCCTEEGKICDPVNKTGVIGV